MAKVLFVLRKTKSKNPCPVLYCRVTANCQTREFSTNEFLACPELWDQSAQMYRQEGPEGEYINMYIDKLRYNLKSISMALAERGTFNADQIIRRLNEPTEKPVTLSEAVNQFIAFQRREGGKAAGTIRHYENYLKNLLEFETRPVYCNEVTLPWAEKFKTFLREKRGCKRTRSSRHIEFFCNALRYAVKLGTIKENLLLNYTIERDPVKEIVYLTRDEAMKFVTAQFKNNTLRECTHLFLYQIARSVEYCNIWGKLESVDVPGAGQIVQGTRGKNNQPFYLPPDPLADGILQIYNGKLPYYDNSTYNKTIRIVAEFLGIDKHLTSHVGRKTFSMSKKAEGWTTDAIKLMLGHSSVRTTETYYLTASPDYLINEMANRS